MFNHQGGELSHKQHSLVLSFNWNYDLINKKGALSLITHCAVHVFINRDRVVSDNPNSSIQ